MYRSGLCTLLQGRTGGVGVILMLHHVVDVPSTEVFSPNRGLEVTSDFLESVIREIADQGYAVVTLDEARRRLLDGDADGRFACFTLDDGYADNYHNAMPVFRRFGAPFTIYVNSGLPDGTMLLWWRVLESVIRQNGSIRAPVGDGEREFDTAGDRSKQAAYETILRSWRSIHPEELRRECRTLAKRYGVDTEKLCRECAISWDQLRDMLETGLLTVGAHTANHASLASLTDDEIVSELQRDCDAIETELGQRPAHFAYPYGDAAAAKPRDFELAREFGFRTATTTRKGVIFPEHRDHLHALPRVSLNGDFQELHYLRALLSGVPFAIRRGFRRLDIS